MFASLSQRLGKIVKTIKGQSRLTEANTNDMLREIRLALLEGDVALPVVKDLMANIKSKALGAEVQDNLNPGQALVAIVEKELVNLLSQYIEPKNQNTFHLNLNNKPPIIILMAGLQGSGKTTTVGKLANFLYRNLNKKVLTVSCDIYRPAAIDQLKYVTEQAGAQWFASTTQQKPLEIAKNALEFANKNYIDIMLVDTAGRLSIDDEMMQELSELYEYLQPQEALLVVDAMQGQDALNTAKAFSQRIQISGLVLTKVDGDSRGGAALSAQYITNKPIKFMGVSEKIDGIQVFDAKRIVDRILGMGDVLAIIEQAQKTLDVEETKKMVQKITSGSGFDLNDFLAQIQTMNKMGGMSSFVDKLPTELSQKATADKMASADKHILRIQGMIHSMTPKERAYPALLKATRKRRIASGAGVTVQEVNKMLANFEQMQTMMKKLKGGGMMKMLRSLGGAAGAKGLKNLNPLNAIKGLKDFGGKS